MDDKLAHWEEMARLGTRGEMVMDILRDWREERETQSAAALDWATRAGAKEQPMPLCPKHPGVRHPVGQPEASGLCPLCLVEEWDAAPDDTPAGFWDELETEIDTHAYGKGHMMAERREIMVQFNDPEEFFTELERDRAHVEGDTVRLTKSYTPTTFDPVYILAVVAGALVRGRLMELTVTLGSVVIARDRTALEPIEKRANALVETLSGRAEALGLEVRAGRFTWR